MALIGSITEGNSLVGSLNATGNLEGSIIGAKGDPGDPGEKGDPGNGIASITKTSETGLVDTYTITYTDGTTTTFTVTNGADGQDGQAGQDGADGADGYSPSASVSKSGDTATVTITDKNGTTIATITDGADGQDGQDGHTPVITASKVGKVTTVYADGVAIATINDGVDGQGAVTDVTVNGVTVMDGDVAKVIVPTKVSDLNNDSGFITGYTETDPVFLASPAHGIGASDITNWNGKQAALVSGTNIKTVNGNSVLGSGDLTIQASSADVTQVNITVADWNSTTTCTKTVTGVTTSNSVVVSPEPSSIGYYVSSGVYCSAQGAGTLTFTAVSTPTVDLTVNVMIVG